MNSLKSIFCRLSDDDFEAVAKNQALFAEPLESKQHVELGNDYRAKLTKEVDITCPVMESGWRQTDIQTMMEATDQRLVNSIAANLSSPTVQSMNTEGLTDEQVAESSIPRNLDISDCERIQDSIVPDTPAETPKTE